MPIQTLVFLGFVLNSLLMTVSPTLEKIGKTMQACERLTSLSSQPISEVAKVIGIRVSNFPGVHFGSLHYRALCNVLYLVENQS